MMMIHNNPYMPIYEPNPNWRDQALCQGCDPELFFPDVGSSWMATIAKQICEQCPVTVQCLDYAITHFEQHGIWGGLSPRERRPLARAYRRRKLAS